MARRKKRGHKLPPGKFASIPVDSIKAAAGVLSAAELRVWLALCAQSQPWSNGTAKLCRSVVNEFHLGSWTTVSAATKKLIEAKLIVRTRKFRPRHCALYGVTHMKLNYDAMEKANASEPDDELATDSCSKTLATRAVARTTSDSSKLSQNGSDSLQRLYRIRPKTTPNSLQVLYQSKTLPDGNGNLGSAPAPVPAPESLLNPPPEAGGRISKLDERIRKARKLLSADPDMDSRPQNSSK